MGKALWISTFTASCLCLFAFAQTSYAISLANSYKVALTMPYAECQTDDTSTTDCTTGSMDLQSIWVFSAGTLEIDDDEVSLRLDDLELRSGLTCTGVYGNTTECSCWDTNNSVQAPCDDYADCSGGDRCGPTSWNDSDNDWFHVDIYMQDGYHYGGTDKIRRDTNCNYSIDFDVKNVSNNRNRQVNQTISANIHMCGFYNRSLGGEIRDVVVYDRDDNILAVATH